MSADMTTEAVAKQKNWFLFHVAVTLLLMFGFGYLPPVSTITPVGMKLLGIFLGLIYAWSTTSLIWPSLFGIVAVGYSGAMTTGEFFKLSFGNETVILIMFALVFTTVLEEMGLIRFLSSWAVSRKITYGRPWLFTFFLLFGSYLCGMLVNELASTIIFWRIYYTIAKEFDFKPYDKYSFIMIFGIVFCANTAGGCTLPFKLAPLIVFGTYTSVTGATVDLFRFMCFSIPLSALMVVLYTVICRVVFRPNIDALKQLNADFVDPKDLILDKKQKAAFALLIIMMVALLAPDVLPNHWWLDQVLTKMTKAGAFIILVGLLFFIRIDNQEVINFKKASQGISWDIVLLFAVILPLSGLLTSDLTGLKPFLVNLFSPILVGQSPLVFIVLVLLLGTVITNFANNAVLAVIFINIICPLATAMGMDPFPIIMVMMFTIQLAYFTPAASAPAAMVFGNSEWVRAGDIYKPIVIVLTLLFVACLVIGLPYAYLLF